MCEYAAVPPFPRKAPGGACAGAVGGRLPHELKKMYFYVMSVRVPSIRKKKERNESD